MAPFSGSFSFPFFRFFAVDNDALYRIHAFRIKRNEKPALHRYDFRLSLDSV